MIQESKEQEKEVIAELVAVEEQTDQNSALIQNVERLVQQIIRELHQATLNNAGAIQPGATAPDWPVERGRA